MAQAVERSVETCAWAFDQLALFHECTEGLVYVLTHCSIGQSKYWQIYALFQQLLKAHVIEVFCPLMDAFEVTDGSAASDNIPPARFPCHAHFKVLKIIFLEQRDVFPV